MPKWIDRLLEFIGTLCLEGAKRLFEARTVAFFVAGALLVASVLLGGWSYRRADRYQRLVEAAISKNTENTPQTLKALESMILGYAERSAAGEEVPYKTQVQKAPLNPGFAAILGEMDGILMQPSPSEVLLVPTVPGAHRQDAVMTNAGLPELPGFLFVPARLLHMSDEFFKEAERPQAQVVARQVPSENPSAPARCTLSLQSKQSGLDRSSGGTASPDPNLCDDVGVTERLAPLLKKATGVPVTTAKLGIAAEPQQAYVITETGINRIVNAGGNDTVRYRTQFNASLVFPARPYYIAAFERIRTRANEVVRLTDGAGLSTPNGVDKDGTPIGGDDDGYFYVSEPYLDVGGNGLVITLARAFRYASHSSGVVAFDLVLSGVEDRLKDMLTDLAGAWSTTTCTQGGDPECKFELGDQDFHERIRRTLEDRVKRLEKNQRSSEIAGNIYLVTTESGASLPTVRVGNLDAVLAWIGRLIAHPNKEVIFSVPIEKQKITETPGNSAAASQPVMAGQLHLLVASINVGQYLQNTAIASAMALFLLGVAITVAIGSLATEAKLKDAKADEEKKLAAAAAKERQDLHDALSNVAKIMMTVNVPYVRLDDEDYILDGNLALAEFLGLPGGRDDIETKIKHTKFENWIARESKREYTRVQRLRRRGERVDPYDLMFERVDGTTVRARVLSSVVPASQESPDSLPETFGILVV